MMIVSTCLAYQHMEATIRQESETVVVSLSGQEKDDVCLTLSYTQAQVLADSIRALLAVMPLALWQKEKDALATGTMMAYLAVEEQTEPGGEAPCRPTVFIAPRENAF